MKYTVNIDEVSSIEEIEGYWTVADFIELLDQFGLSEAESDKYEELKELLFMAISDFEPEEAASILLTYKLGDKLSKGQIDQLSHEMQEDKVSEEYPDISLHPELFQINQLLYAAYNGRFPHVKATQIEASITPVKGNGVSLTPEILLKVIAGAFSDRNVIKRLFSDQLEGNLDFPEADSIVWQLNSLGNSTYRFITSEYWLEKDDFMGFSFEGEYIEPEHTEN